MRKKYDHAPYYDSLFKFNYGMSSEQQLAFCLKCLPPSQRASLSSIYDAKWLYQKIDHLTRLIAAGRSKPSYADSLYSQENIILSRIKQSFDFTGKSIAVPINWKGKME